MISPTQSRLFSTFRGSSHRTRKFLIVVSYLLLFYIMAAFWRLIGQTQYIEQQRSVDDYYENVYIEDEVSEESLTNTSNRQDNTIRKILIYASHRSGSSFTGELFQRNPGVFYVFEPLKLMCLTKSSFMRNVYLQKYIAEYLSQWFQCDYLPMYNESVEKYKHSNHDRRLWIKRIFESDYIKHKTLKLENLISNCKRKSINAIKIIRSNSIENVLPLINEGVKIIHLVRDPRAMALSRLDADYLSNLKHSQNETKYLKMLSRYQNKLYGFVKNTSRMYDNDLKFLNSLISSTKNISLFLEMYKLIRYEDIAYHPIDYGKIIYDFVGLPWLEEIEQWINISTKNGKESLKNKPNFTYSTARNSTATAEGWRAKVPYEIAAKMQEQGFLYEGLKILGYKKFNSKEEYLNLRNSLVEDPALQMPYIA